MTLRTDIETDWQAIAALDEFSVPATWYDDNGTPHSINGWERKPYTRIDVNAPVEAGQHTFRVLSSDVPEAKQGQYIEIESVEYDIIGVQPDGEGTIYLILSESE